MVGNDADTNSSPSQNNNTNSFSDYLKRAVQARGAGDVVLSLHLYLAAYERSLQDSPVPDATVIEGLRQAWNLACESKERSLAEYIFEKIEPYLSAEEVGQYAGRLQRLALEKLEEFGLSREDLEDMTEMLSQDFFGVDPNSLLMRVEQGVPGAGMFGAIQRGLVRGRTSESESEENPFVELASALEASAAESAKAAKEASEQDHVATEATIPEVDDVSASKTVSKDASSDEVVDAEAGAQKDAKILGSTPARQEEKPGNRLGSSANDTPHKTEVGPLNGLIPFEGTPGLFALPNIGAVNPDKSAQQVEKMTYRDLVGYDGTIETMRSFGIGMENDPAFKELVDTLNTRHGLNRIPITDSFLFRSPVREDANQFMLATMGEIGLPAIRMRMEENLQGMPVLCVMASADNQPRLNAARNAIEGRGLLILEDIDLWGAPLSEAGSEESGAFSQVQLSRGAREAMNLIHSAIENPDVFVLMSSSTELDIDDFFLGFLEPLTVVDIEYPTASERADLWANIAKEHPSLKAIDRGALVRYSARMSRFDIYMAAREAVEDAYKTSLMAKKYIPVSAEGLFERIAAYQPLESDEYRQLENAVIDNFREELDHLDDLLGGKEKIDRTSGIVSDEKKGFRGSSVDDNGVEDADEKGRSE